MTEDEAKTKACCGPFAGRAPYGAAADAPEIAVQGLDPDYIVEMAARWPCLGSACMAWRTVKFDATTDKIVAIKEHRRVHGSDLLTAKNAIEALWSPGGAQGFCGLAGAPA